LDNKVFLPRVFFHKATYAQSLQGDGSEHAAPLCEGPAQFAKFSTEKQRSTEKKKKRAKKQIFKNHKLDEIEIRCTSILVLGKLLLFWHSDGSVQQGEAWSCCLPGTS